METKTENLKPNEVAAPTLFVGVGGTGCKIVKKVADLCAPEEKENIKLFQARMKERHKNQLCQYRSAIEQIFKKSPEKIYLYSLPLGETIEIEL